MKIRVPDYFNDFKCIASECEDTCCAGWGIVIDEESYNRYMKVQGEFGERLRSEIVTEGSENIFVLKGDDCPFLTENKMCDIYNNLGEDSLCYTCRQYPRVMEEFGSLREICLSLSCPEACRIILRSDKKVAFNLTENDEEVTSYNDINAMLYLNLMQCRSIVFKILQDRSIELNKRISIVLKFTSEVQEKIDLNNIQGIKSVIEKYSDFAIIEDVVKDLENYKDKENIKYNNINKIFKVFKELKHINPNDPLGLEDALRYFWQSEDDKKIYLEKHKEFDEYFKDKIYKFENILVYFVFRYFMKVVFDYDVSAKIKTAIVSYIMIKELYVVRWIEEGGKLSEKDLVDIAHTYSKDVEHLEENIETLAEIFETNEVFNIDNMILNIIN